MEFVLTGLFLPLVGFLCLLFITNRNIIEVFGPSTILFSFVCFVYILATGNGFGEITLFNWIPMPGLYTDFALHLDHLSLLMCLIITGVGFLIHAYSVGYMDHDRDLGRYFSVMNFFIFSMLLLVLAANLLLFFVGWEGVGLASYLLIGYWYHKPSAAKAAKKAFVVNRIGDLGLLLGIFYTYYLFGTSHIQSVCNQAQVATSVTVLALLYFWGAVGKSAQIPLHVWLPDAMEGPTPVSALIHAATMVTAGVYLVARMHPVFLHSPVALEVVGQVGLATALFAALCATSQTDLKRVLAYSTISQLGLMFLACGAGAFFAAMFHLTTHAFVKALLFLSAGNVIHMMHGTTEMDKMGGLSKVFNKTNILFLIGVLSMSGIPPLAIFFSKDLILEDVASCAHCYYIALAVSLLTAFYLTRAYFLTFRGEPRIDTTDLKEAPRVMILPVSVLGVLSVVGGLLGFAINKPPILMRFLEKDSAEFADKDLTFGFHFSVETWASIIVATLGFTVAAFMYRKKMSSFFLNSFYINELYQKLIIAPLKAISKVVAYFFEPKLDASLQVPVSVSNKTAAALQTIQSGQIRSYIAWMALGAAILVIYLSFEGF